MLALKYWAQRPPTGYFFSAFMNIARTILMLAGDEDAASVILTPGDEAAIAVSRAQSARGEFATDDQVHAVWAKHGL
jgi:hypothetical protein